MKHSRTGVVLAVVMLAVATGAVHADGGLIRVFMAGSLVPDGRVQSIVVNSDTIGADEALLTISTDDRRNPAIGDPVSVAALTAGDGAASVFRGEVTAIEPAPDRSFVVIRASNRLHRLTRGTKSKTYERQSDAAVARAIAEDAGLSFGPTGPEAFVLFDRIVQHNQTDLEFLRARAARIGYEVFVDGTTLHFSRRLDRPVVSPGCGLRVFHPRMSSANQVAAVTVRGWNPNRQEEIVATATRRVIPLSPAATGGALRGSTVDLGFVQTLENEGASYGAAVGTLSALTAADLPSEGDADGNPDLRAGATIEIDQAGGTFNGKYHVTGVSHRYGHSASGGYHTLLRLVREDRAVFMLPEVDDEVLVAFEHGDIARPVVVGSLWNGPDGVAEGRTCGPRPPRH